MAVFRDPAALRRHIEKAVLEQQKEVIITAQAWLGSSKNSPRDTGRLRSSWFAAEGAPSTEVAPEVTARTQRNQRRRRAERGELGRDAGRPQKNAADLEMKLGTDYHLTNNLPYAQPIALGVNLPPSWGGEHRVVSAPKTWFIDFVNSELPKIGDVAGRVIKRRFDL
jgi:hypothetical protein